MAPKASRGQASSTTRSVAEGASRWSLNFREGASAYFGVIGSAILIEPSTIWSRNAFTLAITSG